MAFDRSKHHRRSIRLKGYDYRQPGLYFATICIQGGRNLLGDIVEGEMVLNAAGRLISDERQELPKRFPQIDLDAFVVMPNHMHGIIVITNVGAALVAAQGPDEDGSAVAEDGAPERDAAKSAGVRATTRDAPTEWGRC
jgi:putative transposase